MAERKQGPVKPPTIDLTARETSAEPQKPRRRPAPEAVESPERDPTVASPAGGGQGPDGGPEPKPVPEAPVPPPTPQPPEPPVRAAASRQPGSPWGLLATAAIVGALLGTALTYVLATMVPLVAPPPDLGPEFSAQADRLATLEQRLTAAEAATIDVRAAAEASAGDLSGRVAALESGLDEMRTAAAEPPGLEAVEARLRTLTSRVDAIAAGASSADAGAMAENIEDLEENLAALQAEVGAAAAQSETLRAAVTALETGLAAVRTDIAAAAEAEPEPEPPSTALVAATAALESAFATGRPFATELAGLAAGEPGLAVDDSLALRAGTGLLRPDVLERAFLAAVPDMLAARPAGAEGWQQSAGDWIASLLAIRPAIETEGDAPDAVMSRIEAAMERHDYAAASALFAALPPEMVAAAGAVPEDIAAHAAAAALLEDLRQKARAP